MITETIYTSIGAAALAVDFATSPSRQQEWLRKAERRGHKAAQAGRKVLKPVTGPVAQTLKPVTDAVATIKPVTQTLESAVGDVRRTSLALIGMAEKRSAKVARKARAATPRIKVTATRGTTRRTAKRRTTSPSARATVKVVASTPAPTAQAS